LSLWPINKHNGPLAEAEAPGLQFVAAHPEQGYYREEELGGERYLTAIYADKAVSGTWVSCHNEHPDSPHRDFKLGGVMGGVAIRVALGSR